MPIETYDEFQDIVRRLVESEIEELNGRSLKARIDSVMFVMRYSDECEDPDDNVRVVEIEGDHPGQDNNRLNILAHELLPTALQHNNARACSIVRHTYARQPHFDGLAAIEPQVEVVDVITTDPYRSKTDRYWIKREDGEVSLGGEDHMNSEPDRWSIPCWSALVDILGRRQ